MSRTRTLALVLGAGLTTAFTVSPAPAAGPLPDAGCPRNSIRVAAGRSLQRAVDAAPVGASICIGSGEHRMQAIRPKDKQRFHGEAGAVLNGSRLVTRISREGRFWVAHGQTQSGDRRSGVGVLCRRGRERCTHPEALFIDHKPLYQVARKRELGEGTFFLDYGRGRIYFVDDPVGRRVEASVLPFAFDGRAREILVENLIIEKYSSPVQYAAVGHKGPADHWIVRDAEIRLNYGLGVTVGTHSQVVNNYIYGNGEMGAGCAGSNVLFERNEIASNGYFSGVDAGWEGGAAKCARTNGLIVRRNVLRDNDGYGFWTDIDNINTLYEDNLVEGNGHGGIAHEISYAAIIRNNKFVNNGRDSARWLWGAAILVQNSQNVEVYGNDVDMTAAGNGIALIQQDRGVGRHGPYVTINNHVHGNTLTSNTPDHGASGAIADHDPAGMKAGNNRFNGNRYRVHNASDDHWAWVDDFYGWAEYRSRSGQDATSELQTVAR